MNALVLQLRRRGEVAWRLRGANWASDWLSNHGYEFPQTLWKKMIVAKHYFPPLRSMCCVALLWQWANAVHTTNLTPSYGQNSDVQSYWRIHEHCTISAQPLGVGVSLPDDVSDKGKMNIFLIGGTKVQSEFCPYVQCQTFKPSDTIAHLQWVKSFSTSWLVLFVLFLSAHTQSATWRQDFEMSVRTSKLVFRIVFGL